MASPEVIRYSFQAVEAWARDRGYPRDPQATPHEFVLALGQRYPQLQREFVLLGRLYSQLAYAHESVSDQQAGQLKQLWAGLN